MTSNKFGPVRFIDPLHSPKDGQAPAFAPRTEYEDGLCIDRDVVVPTRDGAAVYVDLYRPESFAEKLPVIICWGPYGKHGAEGFRRIPLLSDAGTRPEWVPSKHALGEGPDPVYWCKHGYAMIFANPRGTWNTPGKYTLLSQQEAEDYHDLVEWAGTQEWSSGKVGTTGVSYLAFSQWNMAATQPPHLAAINPWEGLSDLYRDMFFHGGIPDSQFIKFWLHHICFAQKGDALVEDLAGLIKEHPLFDEYWQSKVADISKINVPAYVVAGYAGQGGIHLRGALEAYKQLHHPNTWLDLHGQKIWGNYYDPRNVEKQRLFFDWALKGHQNAWVKRPKVKIEVRHAGSLGIMRSENEWPIQRTNYTPLYLNARTQRLELDLPAQKSNAEYIAAPQEGHAAGRTAAVFEHTFADDTELTGNMKLKLWVEIDEGTDADLFVAVQKLDSQGRLVNFPCQALSDEGPVALGWLRASHRRLDPRSTAERPWHAHDKEEPLQPHVPVPVEIEIWPSSTLFSAGESLRLVIQGSDIFDKVEVFGHRETRNAGTHRLLTGGEYDAHLLVPVVK